MHALHGAQARQHARRRLRNHRQRIGKAAERQHLHGCIGQASDQQRSQRQFELHAHARAAESQPRCQQWRGLWGAGGLCACTKKS
jgi:hypothetical protein